MWVQYQPENCYQKFYEWESKSYATLLGTESKPSKMVCPVELCQSSSLFSTPDLKRMSDS